MPAKCSAIFINVILFILLTGSSKAAGFETLPFSYKDVTPGDSTRDKKISGIVKINPVQVIFCEIPVSVEFFGKNRSSFQFQVGYIFPRYNALLQKLFETQGEEGDATNEGVFSYRTSPFNNHGVSTKVEFRKYGKLIYYSLQFMYKYCYYNELTYTLHSGGTTYYQTESKDSNIGGIGFVIGRQSEEARIVADWYLGAGVRYRAINVIINEITPISHPGLPTYPNTSETTTSFYPFVNMGFRIGLRFGRD